MKKEPKHTLKKYVVIAEKMRNSNNFLLDISKYSPEELLMIATIAQSDTIFNFCKETMDIDVRKIKAIFEYLNAEEKMMEARAKY